jgi:hypothetical protein
MRNFETWESFFFTKFSINNFQSVSNTILIRVFGATTLSIRTLSITTFSITTLSTMTLGITTHSITIS